MMSRYLLCLIAALALVGPPAWAAPQPDEPPTCTANLEIRGRSDGWITIETEKGDSTPAIEQAALEAFGVRRRPGTRYVPGEPVPVALPVGFGLVQQIAIHPERLRRLAREQGCEELLLEVSDPGLPLFRTVGMERYSWPDRTVFYTYLETEGEPAPAMAVEFGFHLAQGLLWTVAVLLLVAVPAGAARVIRQRVRDGSEANEREAAFRCFYAVQVITQGAWVAWLVVAMPLRFDRMVDFALGDLPGAGGLSLGLALMGPPVIASVLAAAASHPTVARLRGNHWSPLGLALMEACRLGHRLLPLLLTATGAIAADDGQWLVAGLCLAAIYPASRELLVSYMRLSGSDAATIGAGELRDRILAMAGRARVRVRQITVLRESRGALANAYAAGAGHLVLTDHLLSMLSRREVDATVAHELGHLKKNHTGLRTGLLVGPGIAAGLVCMAGMPLGWRLGAIVVFLLAGILILPLSRTQERVADRLAVDYGADPEALITGLCTLTRLSGSPLDWRTEEEALSTHPSTLGRVMAIGTRAGFTVERVQELVSARTGDDRYEMPEGAFAPLEENLAELRRLLVGTVACAAAVAAAAALSAWASNMVAGFRGTSVMLPIAAGMAVTGWSRRSWARRHAVAGTVAAAEEPGIAEATPVVFGPGNGGLRYDGSPFWDEGSVVMGERSLVYTGRKTRFTLSRSEVNRLTLQRGRSLVRWHGAGGISGELVMAPLVEDFRLFHKRLADWAAQTEGPAEGEGPYPPLAGEVAGRRLFPGLIPVTFRDAWLAGWIAVALASGMGTDPALQAGLIAAVAAAFVSLVAA